jgi:hypothetical protein
MKTSLLVDVIEDIVLFATCLVVDGFCGTLGVELDSGV